MLSHAFQIAVDPLQLLNLLFQYIDIFGFLLLGAIGLAVIFGMMRVINLAHGEFITIGAYSTVMSYHAGLPLIAAMLVGVIMTTVFGLIIERLIVQHLYGRLLDSMVATWGVSLIVTQGILIIIGPTLPSIGTPFGSVAYGNYSYGIYRILLGFMGILVLGLLYYIVTYTDFGIYVRATIQDEDMARGLGVDTDRMYLLSFGLGSALAGLTGALFAPTMSISPTLGQSFLVEAFVTVIVGGLSVIAGTTLAGLLLGSIYALFTNLFGTYIGRMALLISAIFIIRLYPGGMTDLMERWRAS